VAESLTRMSAEADGLPMKIRPWIQDFGYGPFPPYSADQVLAEMSAAADTGAEGWMIWNPGASFSRGALGPPRDGEASGPTEVPTPPGSALPASSAAPAASPAG
jgi:hypothetical protein